MNYLAVDIGASSGRHILGTLENGKLSLREIYRFENGMQKYGESLIWDIESLVTEVKNGIKECGKLGVIPDTVAIDTWGVDYVLLDENKKEIMPVMAYRTAENEVAEKELLEVMSQDELYARTGIQKQCYNTIYQLWRDKKNGRLDRAEYFLMIPEYLSYRLTGVMKNEYTNASTTNLLNAKAKTWDKEILKKLGIPEKIFMEPVCPGTSLGNFSAEFAAEAGFNSEVVLCPSHDTASAVCACPIGDDGVYISSGTWSLIGTENLEPQLSDAAKEANFTNEGGIDYRFRFLKNIMGMWLFQNIRKNIDKSKTYDEMMHMAEESTYDKTFDPNARELLAPENMIDAIRGLLGEPELPLGDVLKSVYLSLANSYKKAVEEIENISGKVIREIHIVGGGSRDKYLNRLTGNLTGKKIFIGLSEGTATGNIISQIMYHKKLTLTEARRIIKDTFAIEEVK